MVKPANAQAQAVPHDVSSDDENLDDELLDADDDDFDEMGEIGSDTHGTQHSLAQAGLDVGQFLRKGEGDLDLGGGDTATNQETTFQKELENIYKVLTRSHNTLETENCGISDDIRSNYDEYKAHMEDITPDQNGGVFKRILQPGTGASGGLGKIAKFHYSSFIEGQDEPFDTSLLRGRMNKAKLGEGDLIAGLEMGLATMKEGELADLVIDCKYAYGPLGSPPIIPPECTIRITVRLVECVDEDPVDAMTIEQRQELPFKEAIAYIDRKLDQGKLQFGYGKFNAAINRYKDARMQAEMKRDDWMEEEKLKVKELRVRLYKNLSTCYVKLSMPTKVQIYLKKLNELGVKDSKTLFLEAKVYFMKGEYDKALDVLGAARAMEPGNAEILKFRAQLIKKKSEYEEESKEQAKRMFSEKPVKGGGDTNQ